MDKHRDSPRTGKKNGLLLLILAFYWIAYWESENIFYWLNKRLKSLQLWKIKDNCFLNHNSQQGNANCCRVLYLEWWRRAWEAFSSVMQLIREADERVLCEAQGTLEWAPPEREAHVLERKCQNSRGIRSVLIGSAILRWLSIFVSRLRKNFLQGIKWSSQDMYIKAGFP